MCFGAPSCIIRFRPSLRGGTPRNGRYACSKTHANARGSYLGYIELLGPKGFPIADAAAPEGEGAWFRTCAEERMLGFIMYARGMPQEQIIPAIIEGKLLCNRGRVEEYDALEDLHNQLRARLETEGSVFRAKKLQHEKENFLYFDSKKRGRGSGTTGGDDADDCIKLKIKERTRDNLVHHAHEYVACHVDQHVLLQLLLMDQVAHYLHPY